MLRGPFFVNIFDDYTMKAIHITCKKVKMQNTLITTKSPFSLATQNMCKTFLKCSRHVERSPALHESVLFHPPDPDFRVTVNQFLSYFAKIILKSVFQAICRQWYFPLFWSPVKRLYKQSSKRGLQLPSKPQFWNAQTLIELDIARWKKLFWTDVLRQKIKISNICGRKWFNPFELEIISKISKQHELMYKRLVSGLTIEPSFKLVCFPNFYTAIQTPKGNKNWFHKMGISRNRR